MGKTLFQKIYEKHTVGKLPSGQDQLFIGLHLLHEVTSPQAFSMLRDDGLKALYPNRSFATVDHIIPTTADERPRPLKDPVAEEMFARLEQNCKDFGIRFFGPETGEQGVIHIVGPEEGVTQPGMTIACGDSHTATHGAFGSIAFGIGSSQVADVLATQTLAMAPLKVRKIKFTGSLKKGVFPK
ncbi:MAG: aconitase family protein, partial [Fibromonadales bacterium]|nr:aconitase family protein [Fibromonadales bacterium]